MSYRGSILIDQTGRPAALQPIQEALHNVSESYASGGVASEEHLKLSGCIAAGRRAILDAYGQDVPQLARDIDESTGMPGVAELAVYAAIPRLIPAMNSASLDPELLDVRTKALRGFLRGIVDIEPGEPYALSYCDNATGAPQRSAFGQIQTSQLELYATQGHSQDGLFLRTPLARPGSSKFFRNGIIPVAAMAARTDDGILRLELAAGTRVITNALMGRVAEMMQAETTMAAFEAAVEVVRNAAANSVKLDTVAKPEELAELEDLIRSQFVAAEFGTIDFDNAVLAITNLDTLQQTCLTRSRQNIMRQLALHDPAAHIQKTHEQCVDAARKLFLIDTLPEVKDVQDRDAAVLHARHTFEGAQMLPYIQEAYAQIGTAQSL